MIFFIFMKRFFLSFFIFLFGFLFLIFLAKDVILKEFLERYLIRSFEVESSFHSLNLKLNSLVFNDFYLTKDKYRFSAEKAILEFSLFDLSDIDGYSLEVKRGKLEADDLGNFKFDLVREENHYLLRAFDLKAGRHEFESVDVSFYLKEKILTFYDVQISGFDPVADIFGKMDLTEPEDICGYLILKELPVENLVFLWADEKDITVRGKMGGRADFCFKEGSLYQLTGDIKASEAGMINLKQDVPFAFLENYLDKESFRYLLDSLKNYQYDKASMEFAKEEEALIVRINFDSKKFGARNLIINFHRPDGGEK